MISKINSHISFKRVLITQDIKKLSQENLAKIGPTVNLCKNQFQENDILFFADDKGELVVQIQKANPMNYLLHKDVLKATKMTTEEAYQRIMLAINAQAAHNELWGIKEPVWVERTQNINKMKPHQITAQIGTAIINFNTKYPTTLN